MLSRGDYFDSTGILLVVTPKFSALQRSVLLK